MSETTTVDGDQNEGRSRRFWALVAVVGLGLQLILVVVVGAFVSSFFLSLGGPPETTPTVSFSGDAGAEYILTHEGGDSIDATNVSVLRNDEDVGTWAELGPTTEADDEVSAGHQVVVPNVEADDTITVVWRGEDASATMFEDEVGPVRTPTATATATETPTPKTTETEAPQRSSNTTGASGPKTATAGSFSV